VLTRHDERENKGKGKGEEVSKAGHLVSNSRTESVKVGIDQIEGMYYDENKVRDG